MFEDEVGRRESHPIAAAAQEVLRVGGMADRVRIERREELPGDRTGRNRRALKTTVAAVPVGDRPEVLLRAGRRGRRSHLRLTARWQAGERLEPGARLLDGYLSARPAGP